MNWKRSIIKTWKKGQPFFPGRFNSCGMTCLDATSSSHAKVKPDNCRGRTICNALLLIIRAESKLSKFLRFLPNSEHT